MDGARAGALRRKRMATKLLIANRGEIALRIMRSARDMGLETVAVHSTADEDAMHVRLADESVCIGPPPAAESYLNIPAIVAACEVTDSQLVHPGYGFLSENARFAEILAQHKIGFVGPKSEHIALMGDKIAAKKKAKELGLPIVPGSRGEVTSLADAEKEAERIGYPLLIKASAGGGGRGMKIAHSRADLSLAFSQARQESKAAFGDDAVYMEAYLEAPRHIEVQVLCDSHGRALHLGERDCSLQRRHQKVFEEAPAINLPPRHRRQLGDMAVKAMKKFGYLGVGTLEFLYERGKFYFIEMNTRLQVEHPVTEMVTGLDLVREQIGVALGNKLPYRQSDIRWRGHAIECRINAEHPETFAPAPGKILHYHPPGGPGVRMDSAVYGGYVIPPFYDSLIGKLIVHGDSRADCLNRLQRALHEFVVDGIDSTLPLFESLLQNKDFRNGDYHIHWLEQFLNKT